MDIIKEDPEFKCLYHGIVSKKMSPPCRTKWDNRFIIIKNGYLLYYSENEITAFERTRIINPSPKGIVPLGDCTITPCLEPGRNFCIRLKLPNEETLVIATATIEEQKKLYSILRQAACITWKNANVSFSCKEMQDQIKLRKEFEQMEGILEQFKAAKTKLKEVVDNYEDSQKQRMALAREKEAKEYDIKRLEEQKAEIMEQLIRSSGKSQASEDAKITMKRIARTYSTIHARLENLNKQIEEIDQRYKECAAIGDSLLEEKKVVMDSVMSIKAEADRYLNNSVRIAEAQSCLDHLESVLKEKQYPDISAKATGEVIGDINRLNRFVRDLVYKTMLAVEDQTLMDLTTNDDGKRSSYGTEASNKRTRTEQAESSRN